MFFLLKIILKINQKKDVNAKIERKFSNVKNLKEFSLVTLKTTKRKFVKKTFLQIDTKN